MPRHRLLVRLVAQRRWVLLVVLAVAAAGASAGIRAFEGQDQAINSFGRAEFTRTWFFPPHADEAESDGLGPLFNDKSCSSCHRGAALAGAILSPSNGKNLFTAGMVVRIGDETGTPDPHYGRQLQTGAAPNVSPEARIAVLPTGTRLTFETELFQGPFAEGMASSARLAPPLVGRAAIARVDPAYLATLAAQQAAIGDGIAGIVGRASGGAVGLFGYKATAPDLVHQISEAFSLDLGISSPTVPGDQGDCMPSQADCIAAPGGGDVWRNGMEITTEEINELVAYLNDLAAPAQLAPDHSDNAEFTAAGCAACHVRSLPTTDAGEVIVYSDLLLHDMGPAFADGVGTPEVGSSHWRTAPLLALAPYPGRRYLHDGRAANIDEAVRAHAGEAARSRTAYESLSEDARARLIEYLSRL